MLGTRGLKRKLKGDFIFFLFDDWLQLAISHYFITFSKENADVVIPDDFISITMANRLKNLMFLIQKNTGNRLIFGGGSDWAGRAWRWRLYCRASIIKNL